MKTTFATLLVLGLVAFTGCNKGTEGGPGATNPTNKSHIGQTEDTFSLTVPTLSTKLKQGESKVVDIGIKRGKNFDEDVALKFDNMPQGVTIDPATPTIKHGDSDTKITVKTADDAAVGDFTVKVTGHPTKGTDASNDLKLTVQKK
jgi:uncharacterized membrane protein